MQTNFVYNCGWPQAEAVSVRSGRAFAFLVAQVCGRLREGLPERSARSILSLAFLAPDIVKAAVMGTLPRGFGVSRLIDLPASWAEQRRTLGLSDQSWR